MKYALITGLLDFKIDGAMEKPLKISDGILITNNPCHIKKYIHPNHMPVIGTLELNCIFSGNPVLFVEKEIDSQEEVGIETVNFMRGALAFLTALWVKADNNVNFELAFAISQEDGHVHSNSLAVHFWTCKGEKRVLNIRQSDLVEIANSSHEYYGGIKVSDEPDHTLQRKEFGRVNMAASLLTQARGTSDLGMKIANYCSFFECMLSSNSIELSHQMSERAAFYLCDSPSNRLEHYKKSKRAYGIRSKVVHGDAVSKGQLKEIKNTSVHCDNVARELFRNLNEDKQYQGVLKSEKNEKLDSFMLNKIFGVEAKTPESPS